MGKNFVSNSDAQVLMQAIEQKKLTVSDTMPAASPALLGNTRLYIGSDTASLSKGGVYQCQALEVTPAGSEDPQSEGWYIYNSVDDEYELTTDTTVVAGTTYYTIEWKNISRAEVDLSHYKKIWGGTEAAWNLLTDEEKAQYEYTFFEDDANDYFAVVNAVTEGNMHPVTSNAVFEEMEPLKQNTKGKFELPNGLKMCWGNLGNWSGGSAGAGYRTATYPVTFTQKPTVILVPQTPKSSMEVYVYCPNYDLDASSTTQLCCTPIWVTRSNPASNGWSSDNYQYFAIGY